MPESLSVAETVDRILTALAAPGCDVDAERLRLEELGPCAVPRLVERLRDAAADPSLVLYALQFCWEDAAIEPVVAVLAHPDLEFRRMAAILLDRHRGREYLARRAAQYIAHPDPDVAAFCFEHAEQVHPDPERVAQALAAPHLRPRQARYLSSYYRSALATHTRRLLSSADPELVRGALIGLVHHDDHGEGSIPAVLECLRHPQAQCREAAAEYLAWHGNAAERAPLTTALAHESDCYARSTLLDALGAIARRAERGIVVPRADAPLPAPASDPAQAYRDALSGPADRVTPRMFQVLRSAEALEPRWLYAGRQATEEFSEPRSLRARLLARVHGFPWVDGTDAEEVPGATPAPVAGGLLAPTRETFAGTDRSYGVQTKADDRAFKSLAHVGDDLGWHRDHDAVLAIAAGIVRAVRFEPSWGHLVIIEHALDAAAHADLANQAREFAGTVSEAVIDTAVHLCSLYGHLGPFIRVRPGHAVECGQKIGTIGRTFSRENGGYPAHLHFGLHLGPFRQHPRPGTFVDVNFRGSRYRGRVVSAGPAGIEATIRYRGEPAFEVTRTARWECGYIARWYWDSGAHGWLDPRAWLRRYGASP